MDPAVSKLLDQRGGGYFKTLPSGKLLCSLNGYEVLPRVDALEQFMGGAKYMRLKAAADAKKALAKYEPFLVQSRNFEDKLYCAMTCQLLGKSVAAVRQHMRGKKFQRAKARFEADEADLMDEPPANGKAEPSAPMDESNDSEEVVPAAEATAAAAGVDGEEGMEADEDPDLWIPGEYAEMEAQATAEMKAERRQAAAASGDDGPDRGANGSGQGQVSAPGKSLSGKKAGADSVDRKRPRPGKKHKAKRQRA